MPGRAPASRGGGRPRRGGSSPPAEAVRLDSAGAPQTVDRSDAPIQHGRDGRAALRERTRGPGRRKSHGALDIDRSTGAPAWSTRGAPRIAHSAISTVRYREISNN